MEQLEGEGMRKKRQEAAEAGESAPDARKGSNAGRLTPLDIQQVEFRRSFKGYDEREVDEFLDRLTEDLAAALEEVQRLRQQVNGGLGSVGAGVGDAAAQSDQIIQRARDDAAKIIHDAEQRAKAMTKSLPIGPGDRAAISPFLAKERDFLQSIATLVQNHAESVKGMAASARREAASATEREPAKAATPSASRPVQPATEPKPSGERLGSPTESMEPAVGADSRQGSPGEAAKEGHVRIPEPNPAGVGKDSARRDERSLRDLFWGED